LPKLPCFADKQQGNFPCVYAQVSSNKDRTWALIKNPREDSWAWQREAQNAALKEPKTAVVAAYDLGEWDDIHPQDKESLAKRHVLAAAKLDGEVVIASGPTYKDYRIEGNKVIISFENLHGGLVTRRVSMNKNKGLAPGTDPEASVAPSDQLTGLILCGEDQIFYDAEAKIVGNTVVVTCPQVSKPVAARYAWATFALANLYNKAGQPAFPFRTDFFERPGPYRKARK
jgi:sialate O-acetylesterase